MDLKHYKVTLLIAYSDLEIKVEDEI